MTRTKIAAEDLIEAIRWHKAAAVATNVYPDGIVAYPYHNSKRDCLERAAYHWQMAHYHYAATKRAGR